MKASTDFFITAVPVVGADSEAAEKQRSQGFVRCDYCT